MRIANADRESCLIEGKTTDGNNSGSWETSYKFYLKRIIKMELKPALYGIYILSIEGDSTIVEQTPPYPPRAHKTWEIPLPGNIDRTMKALKLIFSEICPPDKSQIPF